MESKKAKLLIDISKKIVEQYREEFLKVYNMRGSDITIMDGEPFDPGYDLYMRFLDSILQNYEKSIFNGVVLSDKTVEYTNNGMRELEFSDKQSLENKEKREIELASFGIGRLFYHIGIPYYAMYPIIADVVSRLSEYEKKNNKNFKESGYYDVGELKFNFRLKKHMSTSGNFQSEGDKPLLSTFPAQYKLHLYTKPIFDIVNEYIDNEIYKNQITDLDSQNNLARETIEVLCKIKPNGWSSEDKDSEFYSEYFESLERHLKNFGTFDEPREVKNKSSEISKLEDAKDQISKLSDLTQEENELLNRLAQIQQEKQQILGLVSKLDTTKKEEKLSTYTKPEYPNRQYVDEYHYIENGTHYHLPNWDQINSERHEILK